ncbi:hypothetical protein GOV05_04390 [Candidatus Woesearchaeota archaeon]|nr:hypothetical protein [Candidatus Woesearchaeota archaeon]
MSVFTVVGLFAALCTTISFLPQAIRTIKTKQTKDLSLMTYSIFTIGTLLWLVYGVLLRDIPIILANSITAMFTTTILILKLKYEYVKN